MVQEVSPIDIHCELPFTTRLVHVKKTRARMREGVCRMVKKQLRVLAQKQSETNLLFGSS